MGATASVMMEYKMKDVAELVGVSTRTLMRWFREGKIDEVDRDRNNHRVFDEDDVQRIKAFANQRIAAPGKLQSSLFKTEEGI